MGRTAKRSAKRFLCTPFYNIILTFEGCDYLFKKLDLIYKKKKKEGQRKIFLLKGEKGSLQLLCWTMDQRRLRQEKTGPD